jgi:ribonuclease Z
MEIAMKPLFHPVLVNGPFGDPATYVDFLFEKRAMLFDLGDIHGLAPRKILRLSDVFVSHAHMDHFMGFDWLVRICLGRERTLRLFGPAGFLAQVEHRLAGYTWNLVENYDTDFTLDVTEVLSDAEARQARFCCKGAFRREGERELALAGGVLLDDEVFQVRCAILDHKTPCLGFALEERRHVNVWKTRLSELGLPTGPWLQDLKRAVFAGRPDDTPCRAWWRDHEGLHEVVTPLGTLKEKVLRIGPGQKFAYVTDVLYHPENAARIVELVRGADILFIETAFATEHSERAGAKYHLTAHQAGTLARLAGVRSLVPFHFSPLYHDGGDVLRAELELAFRGAPS